MSVYQAANSRANMLQRRCTTVQCLRYRERCTPVRQCCCLPHTFRQTQSVIEPCVHSHAQTPSLVQRLPRQHEKARVTPCYRAFEVCASAYIQSAPSMSAPCLLACLPAAACTHWYEPKKAHPALADARVASAYLSCIVRLARQSAWLRRAQSTGSRSSCTCQRGM